MINYNKEFEKKFETLCRVRDRPDAWHDFIALSGHAINYGFTNNAKSEDEVKRLKNKYSGHELETMVELMSLAGAAYTRNSNQDFLGQLAMTLNVVSNQDGKYFTPFDVSILTARIGCKSIAESVKANGWSTVYDATCGSGAMLIASANECELQGINFRNHIMFVGQDINYITALTCYIQLTLLGCAGYIAVGDTLSKPMTGEALFGADREDLIVFYTPGFYSTVWDDRRRWNLVSRMLRRLS